MRGPSADWCGVVVGHPGGDDGAGLGQAGKDHFVQQRVPHPAIKTLRVLVCPAEIAEEISGVLTNLDDEMLAAAGQINGSHPTNVTQIRRR